MFAQQFRPASLTSRWIDRNKGTEKTSKTDREREREREREKERETEKET